MNLMMLLEMAVQGYAERRAVTCNDQHFTYSQLYQAAGKLSCRVRESGAQHVAFLDVLSPAVPIGLFGASWAGVPFVPFNYRLAPKEVNKLVDRVKPAVLVVGDDYEKSLGSREGVLVISSSELLSEACATGDETPDPDWPMEAENVAILLFTSGTTGVPKAAVLRHKHLVSYIFGSVEFMGAAEHEASLVAVPPYHIAAMAAVLSSVYAGRRIVQLKNFAAADWLALAEKEAVTNAFVVPTMLSRIVAEMDLQGSSPPRALRALAYGGGKMPLPVIRRAMSLFSQETDFTNAYGLTETSSTIAVLGPDDHRTAFNSNDPVVIRRLASVGKPLPSIEIEIRDDHGRPLEANQQGEVYVRGEQVSGEYLGNENRQLDTGWFPTRDSGYLDEGGYLFLEGRIDEVIVRGGENMSPGEIEEVLLEHPAVADVAVVGVPDVEWGEAIASVIVLKEGRSASAEEFQSWVREHLRSTRVPQCVRFESGLPYNETGKLLRNKVREMLANTQKITH